MKRLMKPVLMYTWTDEDGRIHPLRFQAELEPSVATTIRIGSVVLQETERIAGQHVINFRCLSLVENRERQYDLCYELATCRWYLARW